MKKETLGGPKTNSGKKISSKNAIKHGLTGLNFIASAEQTRYELLIEKLQEEYDTKTITEELYLSRIASLQIRLERIINAEQAAFAIAQDEITYGGKIFEKLHLTDKAKRQFLINNLAGLYKKDSTATMLKSFFQNILAQELHSLMAQKPINEYQQIIDHAYLLHIYLIAIAFQRNMTVSIMFSSCSSGYHELVSEIVNIPKVSEEAFASSEKSEINISEISSNDIKKFTELLYKKMISLLNLKNIATHFEQTLVQHTQAAMPDLATMDRFMRYSTTLGNQHSKATGELRHIIKERKAAEKTITDK